MKIREKNFQAGDTFGDDIHSYTVVGFLPHYVRVTCNKCNTTQSFHLDDDLEENILKWKNYCCPEKNRYYIYDDGQRKLRIENRSLENPMIFFLKNLVPGEILFDRFEVQKTSPRGFGILASCLVCKNLIYITTDNDDLCNYVYKGIIPGAGTKLIPIDACCRKAKKVIRDNKRETAKKERLVKNKELSKKGILKENGRTLYKWGDSYMDIHELSDQYGFSEQRIREVIKEAAKTDDAISMIYEANEHNLDLGKLHKLIRGGKSLEEAVEKLESHTISRIAKTIEHLEITEDD